MERKPSYKVVFLGDTSVGKTSIANRLYLNKFKNDNYPTVGSSYCCLDDVSKNFNIDIWDTAGQERYRSLAKLYYRNSDIVLVVCDLSNRESLKMVRYWINKLIQEESEATIILVGNKTDLEKTEEIVYLDYFPLALFFNKKMKKTGNIVYYFIITQ
jgi:small GTP-binding protein